MASSARREVHDAAVPVWKPRPVWPASQKASANWPRLVEAEGRPKLDLALVGRAGGRIGRSLWAAAFRIGRRPRRRRPRAAVAGLQRATRRRRAWQVASSK
eukprot:scaffold1839_cov60-Phaeocystis_antarctica.AAC.2